MNSPKFWYDKIKRKDQEINRLNLILNQNEGKLLGIYEICDKRQNTIQK